MTNGILEPMYILGPGLDLQFLVHWIGKSDDFSSPW